MRFLRLLYCLLVVAFAMNVHLAAQDIRVRATLDTASMRIGEQTALRLSIEHTPGVVVQFPFLADSLVSKVEIVNRTPIDSAMQENGRVLERQAFTITSFDDGLYELPALTFTYRKPNDRTEYTIQTQPITLAVTAVPLAQNPDSSNASAENDNLRDIKPPLSVPRTFMEVAPYLAAALAVIGGIIWTVWYIRKRRANAPTALAVKHVPQRPAYEIAMEALERLRKERLWQSGAVKEYHTRLTDILRVYVEETFGVTTLEATTDEILAELPTKSCPASIIEMLRSVLEKADMVKFARYEPLADENERSIRIATELVQITALKEQTTNA
jgi:hypothetical protein